MKIKKGDILWAYSFPKDFGKTRITDILIIPGRPRHFGMMFTVVFDEVFNFFVRDFGFYLRFKFGKTKYIYTKWLVLLPLAYLLDPFFMLWVKRNELERDLINFIKNKLKDV